MRKKRSFNRFLAALSIILAPLLVSCGPIERGWEYITGDTPIHEEIDREIDKFEKNNPVVKEKGECKTLYSEVHPHTMVFFMNDCANWDPNKVHVYLFMDLENIKYSSVLAATIVAQFLGRVPEYKVVYEGTKEQHNRKIKITVLELKNFTVDDVKALAKKKKQGN